jgi:hypothetical protein
VADFETNLRWLSERGNPVGAEELIERIEAEMAGDPLVVVNKRREGTIMSKTQQSPTTNRPKRYRGPAWGVAVFVAILAVAGLYFAFADDTDVVADNPPPPTTMAPDVETMTDLEVIEAGVAALYSGDAEHAVELFELQDGDDDQIRQEAAYQAAIGGRLTLNCTEVSTPGVFTCNVPYHNGVTDAVGYVDSPGDTNRVVVQDGVITEFAIPEHEFLLYEVGNFLDEQVEGQEGCVDDLTPPGGRFLLRTPECANLIMDHLDEWADWCGQIVTPDPLFASGCDTPENGQPVAELRQSHELFEDEVSFGLTGAGLPEGWVYSIFGWDFTPTMKTLLLYSEYDERVVLVADPLPVETGCEVGPAPADAEALAQSIRTDPDLDVSEPVAVSVGGIEGVRMDVVAAPGASNCEGEESPGVLAATELNDESRLVEMPVGSRMRLYLVDLPEEISARILAIAIAAPESRFDQVVEAAAPIVDSVEFHTE